MTHDDFLIPNSDDISPADIQSNADLSEADLSEADLSEADLTDANLSGADLSHASFRSADLTDADLSNAGLSDASLQRADLTDAKFYDAHFSQFSSVGLQNATLRRADLTDAKLCRAKLSNADLRDADLSDADLKNANLSDAVLFGADLTDAILPEDFDPRENGANKSRAPSSDTNVSPDSGEGGDDNPDPTVVSVSEKTEPDSESVFSADRIPSLPLSVVQSPSPQADIEYGMVADGEMIGSGGQATVKRTSLPGTDSPDTIAVKEPLAPSETVSREVATSFEEEATTWQKVATRERTDPYRDTDHIVGVVAIGEELPWVAMEYMDAGSLADKLAKYPEGLPVEQAVWIGECLCKGLKVAHDVGVAHLDLKPDNILFRETPENVWDVPKIADWGLARALIKNSGSMQAMSVAYAAPEQFDSGEFGTPDSYTDIYQVGAILYEMLTGRPPYTGGHASILHDVVGREEPAPPSDRREAVPSTLDEIVLQALSREKPQRYRGSIVQLEDALSGLRE